MTTAVTYTFSNSTTADATQVNQNFTDVLAGLNGVDKLTTRGDVLTRNATVYSRLALGTAGKRLLSDGTDIAWGWTPAIVAKSADYTVTDTDGVEAIWMTTGASNRTVTLPAAANSTNRIIVVTKVDSGAGTCILDGNASETIDGATTVTMNSQYQSLKIQCNGTSWATIGTSPTARSIAGDVTGTAVPTGKIGERLQISRVFSIATSLTNNVVVNVGNTTFITLTPGIWVMGAHVGYVMGATTSYTYTEFGISKTSVTIPGSDTQEVMTSGEIAKQNQFVATVNGGGNLTYTIAPDQVLVTTNTNYYLVARAGFTVSTCKVIGSLFAIRIA